MFDSKGKYSYGRKMRRDIILEIKIKLPVDKTGNPDWQFMKNYMTSLEEMNTEAVEYVRGIPVVKVFQQTIYSFKNFHRCIMNYNKMVFGYTRMWEKPMSLYTVIINGFVFFLAPLAILLIGYSGNYASVLLNFFLFVLILPKYHEEYVSQSGFGAGE